MKHDSLLSVTLGMETWSIPLSLRLHGIFRWERNTTVMELIWNLRWLYSPTSTQRGGAGTGSSVATPFSFCNTRMYLIVCHPKSYPRGQFWSLGNCWLFQRPFTFLLGMQETSFPQASMKTEPRDHILANGILVEWYILLWVWLRKTFLCCFRFL